jgi:hypothetical protein
MDPLPTARPSKFERFGLHLLSRFQRSNRTGDAFSLPDDELAGQVNRISTWGIALSCLVGLIFVFPMIYVDVLFEKDSPWVHYGWVVGVMAVGTIIEFYYIFLISLKAVHKVSELIHLEAVTHDSLENGIFGVRNILARTALEIPDPELRLLGIDPFKRISKKNLFVLGLLYKGKIIVTNLALKAILRLTVGSAFLGIPILYVAIPVEMFWNGMVILKVIREARLRLFGYALANRIADSVEKEGYLQVLSPAAKKGCLRAIGNAVVMTQNYHPNMVILLLRFQDLLQIHEEDRYDDWQPFLETLDEVSEEERNFLLDLLTVAAAFDGKLSAIEREHLNEAYQQDAGIYLQRLHALTDNLKDGRLNAALSLCRLDFIKG